MHILKNLITSLLMLVVMTSGVWANCGCNQPDEHCTACTADGHCFGHCEDADGGGGGGGCPCGTDGIGNCNWANCSGGGGGPTSTPAPWTVQGSKVTLSNYGNSSTITGQMVIVEKKSDPQLRSSVTTQPYTINSLSKVINQPPTPPYTVGAGILNNTYTASVSVPSGWDIFSTWCKNRTDCHTVSSPRTGNPVEMALGREGGYADLQWHFVAPPANLKALCNITGDKATISWDGPSDITSYPIRVDRIEYNDLPFVCDPNSNGPTNICKYINGTSTTIDVEKWVSNYWWLHSGNYWEAVANKSFVCGPPPVSSIWISQPNCANSPGRYSVYSPIRFDGYPSSSTGLSQSDMFIAKKCGDDLCTYTPGSPASWCDTAQGQMQYNATTQIGMFCKIKTETFNGTVTWPQHYQAVWPPNSAGTYYAVINARSSNPGVFLCSGNPKCEYSDSTLVKYPGTTCGNGRFAPCQIGADPGKVGYPALGGDGSNLWGESIEFEVLETSACLIPTNTPTPTPVSCANNPLPANTIVKNGTTGVATQDINILSQRVNLQPYQTYRISIDSKNLLSLPATYPGIFINAKILAYKQDSSGIMVPTTINYSLGQISKTQNVSIVHRRDWQSEQYQYADITIYARVYPADTTYSQAPGAAKYISFLKSQVTEKILQIASFHKVFAAGIPVPTIPGGISYRFQVSGASFACPPAPTTPPAPTATLTATPTPTVTTAPEPTPSSFPELRVTGVIQQQTGTTSRSVTSDNYLPFVNSINLNNSSKWNISEETGCATGYTPSTMYGSTGKWSAYGAEYTFPPFVAGKGYCTAPVVTATGFVMPVIATVNTSGMPAAFYELLTYSVNITSTNPTVLNIPIKYNGGSWIRLRDTSLTRPVAATLTNNIPYVVAAFDSTDETDRSMISESNTGGGGFVPSNVSLEPLDIASSNSWRLPLGYTFNTSDFTNTLDKFVETLLRKQGYQSITASSTVNLASGTINILPEGSSVEQVNISGTGASVLISLNESGLLGDITITNGTGGTGVVLVIANNINIGPSVTAINGVYIAKDKMSLGGGTNALKITGNVLTGGGIEDLRSRSDEDHARPSVFIKFDYEMYQKLIKIIGIVRSRG